jgi:integrase
MASLEIRKRRDQSVCYRVRWRTGGTREGSWNSESFEDERAAQRFQLDVEEAGEHWPKGWTKGVGYPERAVGTTHAFEDFALLYLNTRKRAQPDTVKRYRAQVKNLAAAFPVIEDVDDQAIADWITDMQRLGKSPKTISNYHGLLFAVMAYAVKKQLRLTNPCADTQLPDRKRDQADVITALSEAQYRLVRDHAHEDVRDLIEVAVGTGARWGELTALTVGDLDLDAATPTLRINKAWKHNATPGDERAEGEGRYILGPPKSRRSIRTITLAPPLVATLRRVIESKGPRDLVFTAVRGGAWRQPDFYRHRWQPAVAAAQKAGLAKSPRFHDLRHTHAVWLITAGVPLPVIQSRLGHESIQITVDVYGGFLSQANAAADAAIAAALGGGEVRPHLTVISGERDEPIRSDGQEPPAAAAR